MKKYILIILFPNLIFAQNDLSLLNAIKIGLEENYDILISRNNQKINQINNNWGNAGALPSINLSLKQEEALSDQTNNPTSFLPYALRSSAINGNANVRWTLFNGFAIRANKEKLKNFELIYEYFGNKVDLVVTGDYGGITPSTIINCTTDKAKIVRIGKGKISLID